MKQMIFLLFLIALFAAGSAEAVDYYISPTGSNANSCAQAQSSSTPKLNFNDSSPGANDGVFRCMAAGDNLIIRGGTFTPSHFVDLTGDAYAPGVPSGTDDNNRTTITVFPGETARIAPTAYPIGAVFSFLNSSTQSYITIDGGVNCGRGTTGACRLILDGGGMDNGAVLSTGGATHITVNGVEITQDDYQTACGSVDCAVNGASFGGLGNIISNSNIHHNGIVAPGQPVATGGYGMYTGGVAAFTIADNLIHHNGGYGIHHNPQGLFPDGTHGLRIYGNEIYNNGQSNVQGGSQVVIRYCFDCFVYNNIIRDSVGNNFGLEFGSWTFNLHAYSNTIVRNNWSGITLTDLSNDVHPIVRNNIVRDNGAGGGGGQNIWYERNPNVTVTHSNNLCHGTGGTANCEGSGDPLFFDYANNDFRIQSGSPAKDGGTDLSTALGCTTGVNCRDIASVLRGTLWDIGAFEFQGAPSPPLLVLQMGLDEGSGTAPQDSSGQANHGSFAGGVGYTVNGKYNKALSFAGSGPVTVTHTSNLNASNGFTLMAWVKPASATSNWTTIFAKGSNYYLFATSNGECGNGAIVGGFYTGVTQNLCYGTPLTANVWTHVALKYDASAQLITLYIDGSPVTTQAVSGTMVTNSSNLLIGASGVGEYFVGDIDAPRIYTNEARTQAQIQSDMNTPINSITPTQKLLVGSGSLKLGASATAMKMEGLQ